MGVSVTSKWDKNVARVPLSSAQADLIPLPHTVVVLEEFLVVWDAVFSIDETALKVFPVSIRAYEAEHRVPSSPGILGSSSGWGRGKKCC